MNSKSDREADNCGVQTTATISPPTPEAEDLTLEELEELEAQLWHPEKRDCRWPLQCNVGDKFPVLVDARPNARVWWIGTVVSVDLVSQAVKFTFPGMFFLQHMCLLVAAHTPCSE